MREYEHLPVGQWVKGERKCRYGRKKISGWIEGMEGECYVVYVPAEGKEYTIDPKYLFSMGCTVETDPTLINLALQTKDKEWFKQLTGV